MRAEEYGRKALQIVKDKGQKAPDKMLWSARVLDDYLTAMPQWLANRAVYWGRFFNDFERLVESGKMEEATDLLERARITIKTPWQHYVGAVIASSDF